mmetsp:Transcript_116907/g.325800  ORF Transcript_116907/g.325800 Transcript_116907/m.325800 type:complete len:293 (-) Transcript_116907:262-1140(-)
MALAALQWQALQLGCRRRNVAPPRARARGRRRRPLSPAERHPQGLPAKARHQPGTPASPRRKRPAASELARPPLLVAKGLPLPPPSPAKPIAPAPWQTKGQQSARSAVPPLARAPPRALAPRLLHLRNCCSSCSFLASKSGLGPVAPLLPRVPLSVLPAGAPEALWASTAVPSALSGCIGGLCRTPARGSSPPARPASAPSHAPCARPEDRRCAPSAHGLCGQPPGLAPAPIARRARAADAPPAAEAFCGLPPGPLGVQQLRNLACRRSRALVHGASQRAPPDPSKPDRGGS